MTRLGQCSRVLRASVCAFLGIVLAAGAFATAKALTPIQGAPPAAAVQKIGPGYARMQPVNFGKPERILHSVTYYPQAAAPAAQPQPQLAPKVYPQVAAPTVQKTMLPRSAPALDVATSLPQPIIVGALPFIPSDRHSIN